MEISKCDHETSRILACWHAGLIDWQEARALIFNLPSQDQDPTPPPEPPEPAVSDALLEVLRLLPGFWYIATPYSRYAAGLEAAFRDAAIATGWLVARGIRCFSPVTHMHPVAVHAGLDPLDHGIWLPADEPMMQAAAGLLVVKMPGWQDSHGVGVEVDGFRRANKPIHWLPWPLEEEGA